MSPDLPSLAWMWRRIDTGCGGCWLWKGSKNQHGYGQVVVRGKSVVAHRAMWLLLRGEIPTGLDLDHLCRVRNCVNPDHLDPVTRAENMARAPWTVADLQREKTHCPAGHPYEGANLVVRDGKRTCVTCKQQQDRASYLRRKVQE